MMILFTLLLCIGLSACSLLEPGRRGIVLANRTDAPVWYIAMERESAYLVDPIPYVSLAENQFEKVETGASEHVVGIDDYEPGEDVAFFLYTKTLLEGRAFLRFSGTLAATAEELRRGGLVMVNESDLSVREHWPPGED